MPGAMSIRAKLVSILLQRISFVGEPAIKMSILPTIGDNNFDMHNLPKVSRNYIDKYDNR